MPSDIVLQLAGEIRSLGLLDALTVGTLAVLEGILSVDNALVLAILVRPLPPPQRRKVLTYGILGAFAFRFVALAAAQTVMRMTVFKMLGGAYLVYIAMKHMFFFYKEDAHRPRDSVARSFWKSVLLVELTDIAFAIDSITAAVAMSNRLLIVWMGGVLGIVFLRFLSSLFVLLLEKQPKVEDLAYQLVLFVGTKLLLESFDVQISHTIFWTMMAVIAVLGSALVYRDHHQRKTRTQFEDRLVERLRAGEISVEELLSLDALPKKAVHYLRDAGYFCKADAASLIQTGARRNADG